MVTSITVSSKGVGYTAGSTRIDIIYPGSGAQFQTKLTELSINEAATGNELGDSNFVSPKTTDVFGGGCFQGENYLIYGGEYGYLTIQSNYVSYLRTVLVLTLLTYCKNYLLQCIHPLLVGHMTDIRSTDLMDMKIQRTLHHLTHTNVLEAVIE